MPKPSILMLITNLTFGGAQRVFYDQGLLLATRYDVTEITFDLSQGHAFSTGNEVLSLDVAGGGGFAARVANFARRVRALTAIKQARLPMLTISHLEGADYINVLSRRTDNILLVVHGSKLHDENIRGALGWLRRRLLIPWLYNRANKIVTVSLEIATELVSLGVHSSLICPIPNFFDPAAITDRSLEPLSREELALFGGPPVLVTSGRLTLQKNQAGMLAMFAELIKRRPARLLLLGNGELRQQLIDQAKALGLNVGEGPGGDHDVYFLGFQDNPFRLQRHADLFILTSGWEGFPMVLGEAMACGLPIVSADCPTGPREFLAPDTIGHFVRPLRVAEPCDFGLLMPIPTAGDQSTITPWVETLHGLLGDLTERQRLAGLSLARAEDFSSEAIAPRWFALIDELLGPLATTSS